eukprot:IDg10036t1
MLSAAVVVILPSGSSSLLGRVLQPFAAGALLSDCALHLLPTIYASDAANAAKYLLFGIAIFFALDCVARRLGDAAAGDRCCARRSAAVLNLAADGVHNFADGLAIGAAFVASPAAGASTAIAVMAHELPQEAADFAVLLRAGWSRRAAFVANVACAGTAVVGTALALALDAAAGAAAAARILPVAAGALLYLAFTGVIPDVVSDVTERPGGKPLSVLAFLARLVVALASAAVGVALVSAVELLHDH